MISERELALRLRQHELLGRSAALRVRLATEAAVLQGPLTLADRVRDGWHWLRAHPEWPLGAAVVLVVLRPRRTLRLALRLWSLWGLVRQVQGRLAGLR